LNCQISTQRLGAWLGVSFLVIVGAKLWLIGIYGTESPLGDPWIEARLLFKPWLEGHWTWNDLFQPQNEHRIFCTRVLDLLELQVNGQWDPILQMVVNALLHAGFACGLIYLLWRVFGRKNAGLICLLVLPFFVLPYSVENTTHGFQSQEYFLEIFSVAAMVGLGFGQPAGPLWFGGLLSALLAIVTMVSGFLAALAVMGLVLLRVLKQRTINRGQGLTLVTALAITTLGWAVNIVAPALPQDRARTLQEFLGSWLENLAWPLSHHPGVAILICLPLVLTLILYWRRDFKNARAAEFVLVLGFWGMLQSAALAYGRNGTIDCSRYMDAESFPALASLASLFVLAENLETRRFSSRLKLNLAVWWTIFLLGGMCYTSRSVSFLFLYGARRSELLAMENLRAYIVTGDATWSDSNLPQADSDRLAKLLREPRLLAILPPDMRPPLPVEPGPGTAAAFRADGFPPTRPKHEFTQVWGDYATNGVTQAGKFISRDITASLPDILLPVVCGPDSAGVSVRLVDAAGRVTRLPLQNTSAWQTLSVKAPDRPFRVEIEHRQPGSWVAVGGIKEAGRFYGLVRFFLRCAVAVFVAGLFGLGLLTFAGLRGTAGQPRDLRPLLAWLVLLAALAAAWDWRDASGVQYAAEMHKSWAAQFAAEGQRARAIIHLHEALWLDPGDDGAQNELTRLAHETARPGGP
jgi:hypothetical protein